MNNQPVFRGAVRVVAAFLIAVASEAVTHGESFFLKVDTNNFTGLKEWICPKG